MASIRKRGIKWQAQVRREGHPLLTRTFASKTDAAVWARQTETRLDSPVPGGDLRVLDRITLGDLLRRYREEQTPKKKGADAEAYRIGSMLKEPLARTSLSKLSTDLLANHRDARLRKVAAATVRRELGILRHVIEVARIDWGYPLPINPVAMIRSPEASKARERRLEQGELASLLSACEKTRSWFLEPTIRLALETGMRRGELLSLRWSDLEPSTKTIRIRETKNGHPRTVPLSDNALAILTVLPRTDTRVLPVSANALRLAWERLKTRAGIVDLRFHDLRHEAVSRFFERGLSVPEVALISGHRDPRMLFRYTHLKAETVARKL